MPDFIYQVFHRPFLSQCRILVLGLVFLLTQPGADAWGQAGKPDVLYYKSWAIVIGIDDYVMAPKLTGAVSGAKSVAQAFRSMGFDEIIEVYDQKANFKQLHYIFEEFLPRKVGRLDRLVFFFAGHSGSTKDVEGKLVGYLIPWDSKEGNVRRSLTLHQLKALSKRIMSKHIAFFLDTGISGWQVTPPQQLTLEGRLAPENEKEKRAVQLLTAGKQGEEPVREEEPDLFVQALLAGLDGQSDQNGDGWIYASELGTFVAKRVAEQSQDRQHPEFVQLDGDGDMVLKEGPSVATQEPVTAEERQRAARELYGQALSALKQKESVREALQKLNTALGYDPTYGNAYVLKAYVLLDLLPNIEGALLSALQGVQYAPKNPDSHYTLGLVLEQRQEFQDAERAYHKALEIKPSYVDVYLTLGDLYAKKLENQTKAVESYERYLELGGNSNQAREYISNARSKKKPSAP